MDGSDSESDNEGKDEEDGDSNMPSKNFAILLIEKFIYEDSDKNFYLEEALKHKGTYLAHNFNSWYNAEMLSFQFRYNYIDVFYLHLPYPSKVSKQCNQLKLS